MLLKKGTTDKQMNSVPLQFYLTNRRTSSVDHSGCMEKQQHKKTCPNSEYILIRRQSQVLDLGSKHIIRPTEQKQEPLQPNSVKKQQNLFLKADPMLLFVSFDVFYIFIIIMFSLFGTFSLSEPVCITTRRNLTKYKTRSGNKISISSQTLLKYKGLNCTQSVDKLFDHTPGVRTHLISPPPSLLPPFY